MHYLYGLFAGFFVPPAYNQTGIRKARHYSPFLLPYLTPGRLAPGIPCSLHGAYQFSEYPAHLFLLIPLVKFT